MEAEGLIILQQVALVMNLGALVLALCQVRHARVRPGWLLLITGMAVSALPGATGVFSDGAAAADPFLVYAEFGAALCWVLGLFWIATGVGPLKTGGGIFSAGQQYRHMVDSAREGVVLLDDGARILYVNPFLARMLGYEVAEMQGCPLFRFMDSQARVEAEIAFKRHRLGEGEQYDLRFRRRDGKDLWAIFSCNQLVDEQGNVLGVMGVVTDITERKVAEERTVRKAQCDVLTGLPNRALLRDRLDQALARGKRYGKEVAVLFLDLDGFKPINDRYGHSAGDQVLREVAHRLSSRVRQVDTVARYGGDEFVVVLQDLAGGGEARHLAEDLIELLNRPYEVAQERCSVGVSVGISLFPSDGEGGGDLVGKADQAMYRAKEEGRNCYRMFAGE